MREKIKKIWNRMPLGKKILLEITLMALSIFASNLFIYWQVNRTLQKMDTVYATNVNLSELSDALARVQDGLYSYISVQSSQALENYYRSEQDYAALLDGLNMELIDSPVKILERNIRNMSETYLDIAAEAVSAKRGRNVEKYKDSYENASRHYQYINDDISQLNELQFKSNMARYEMLRQALNYMELVSSMVLVCVMVVGIAILMAMTRDIVNPLTNLAHTAKLVGQGHFYLKMPPTESEDEIGILTKTFNQMIGSLEEYVDRIKESAEKEQKMIGKELLMENHLKEAQLKYLQSQINPHFLFNSLNAGAQLAVMEDAEKTCIFLEKMADFFRYNVKKGLEDASVKEEVESVENYIYILNVRFDGDIHYEADIDKNMEDVHMPSMILQPIVENAINHGIRNIDWEGKICLSVKRKEDYLVIQVKDNGKGMDEETIRRILSRTGMPRSNKDGNSTGIGMDNVRNRLEMYYDCRDIMEICSEGENKGTQVTLRIPLKGEERDVSDIIGG